MGSAIYVHVALTAACLAMVGVVLLEVRANRRRLARLDRHRAEDLRALIEQMTRAQADQHSETTEQVTTALRAAVLDIEALIRRLSGPSIPPKPSLPSAVTATPLPSSGVPTTGPRPPMASVTLASASPPSIPNPPVRRAPPIATFVEPEEDRTVERTTCPTSLPSSSVPSSALKSIDEEDDDITRVLAPSPPSSSSRDERPSGLHPVFASPRN